ncbi:pyridoxamine 5'-phosphate oxidase family protein [Amycolatopsis acidicola]|uniref:Pyridoxamine 5'-phosphate oxidase family protein n=1 Tax=Amycolatopsis acidicola TaxID=2596893 RepID=A0A5N0UNY8_9PSEU|nr:pyridoxamine 5'-phosphate oxidase family protein [Amycolatopsis acidicola]KAA9152168.1 pyridoxamine 5'-phosphate oxidase family protein [Amycolatopsis acidicola]
MNELRPLTRRECLELLGSATVGRLVFSEGALPAIRPVNFVLHEGDVVLRTSRAGALGKLSDEVVAFEVDEIHPETHTGWSVVAVGKIDPVTDIDEIVALADPRRRPWAPGERDRFLRIRVEIVNGRKVSLGGPYTG